MKKEIIIGLIIGFSLISVSGISISICKLQNTEEHLVNHSGVFIDNQTIFLKASGTPYVDRIIWVCPGEVKKINSENCKYNSINEGVPKENILNNATIEINGQKLKITKEGLFCLGKKLF